MWNAPKRQEFEIAWTPVDVRGGLCPGSSSAASLNCRSLSHADVLVGDAVVEEISIVLADHAFHEDHIRYLPNFLPFLLGRENRGVASPEQLSRIVAIENCDARSIYQFVIGTVIDENDSFWCDDWRGTRFRD